MFVPIAVDCDRLGGSWSVQVSHVLVESIQVWFVQVTVGGANADDPADHVHHHIDDGAEPVQVQNH